MWLSWAVYTSAVGISDLQKVENACTGNSRKKDVNGRWLGDVGGDSDSLTSPSPALIYLVLSCPAPSCPALPSPALSNPVLCPALPNPAPTPACHESGRVLECSPAFRPRLPALYVG